MIVAAAMPVRAGGRRRELRKARREMVKVEVRKICGGGAAADVGLEVWETEGDGMCENMDAVRHVSETSRGTLRSGELWMRTHQKIGYNRWP